MPARRPLAPAAGPGCLLLPLLAGTGTSCLAQFLLLLVSAGRTAAVWIAEAGHFNMADPARTTTTFLVVQEEIRRLKEQGAAEPMDEDADREGDGGAGTSKQGSQRQRGRATRVVEDDDDEEEEEEEEERDHSPHGYSDQDAEY